MALFQKKQESGSVIPIYSLGQNKTVLVVGLGNIGKQYDSTRHNIGFAALDAFTASQAFDPWIDKRDFKCQLTSLQMGDTRVIAIKPTTFMNLSGEAIQATAHFYKIPTDKIVIVHDELDIPFGQIRTRMGGSSAGNNGIKSAIQHVGENTGRIRIGVKAETPMDASDFVLAKFGPEEQTQLPNLYKETTAFLTEYIYSGGQLQAETRSFIV